MNKLYYFLFKWRPFHWRSIWVYELISFTIWYISVILLAYGIQSYNLNIFRIIIFSVISLHSGYFATLIWNDINDIEIDRIVHPDRPLPGKRISSHRYFAIALIFSGLTFLFAFLVDFLCLILVGGAALFVAIHNKYLKRRIKIPAYSELVTPIQWCIVPVFGYIALKNYNILPIFLLVIFTYLADMSHDIAEGIHDSVGDKKYNVNTFSTSFGDKIASKVSFTFLIISGIFGITLYFYTPLSLLYLILFIIIWLYTIFSSYKMIVCDVEEIKKTGQFVGQRVFNYLLVTYIFVFFDILVQNLINN